MDEKKRFPLRIKKANPYIFISPFFIFFAVFGLYPFLSGLWISFHERAGPLGIGNYIFILKDGRFWKSIGNASLFALGGVFGILPIALIAALMLNSSMMGIKRGFVSTVFFVPNVTSAIVVGIVFRIIFRREAGILNALLAYVHIPAIGFLVDPRWAVPAMVIIACWRYFGVNSLYFLSGIQAIPADMGEAARIDGAGRWTEFWRIKFPLLRPILTFIVFQAITGAFGAFGDIYALTGGNTGTRDSFLYPVIYLYSTMFKNGQVNRAAAMGYIIAAVLFVITSIQRRLFADEEGGNLL